MKRWYLYIVAGIIVCGGAWYLRPRRLQNVPCTIGATDCIPVNTGYCVTSDPQPKVLHCCPGSWGTSHWQADRACE